MLCKCSFRATAVALRRLLNITLSFSLHG